MVLAWFKAVCIADQYALEIKKEYFVRTLGDCLTNSIIRLSLLKKVSSYEPAIQHEKINGNKNK